MLLGIGDDRQIKIEEEDNSVWMMLSAFEEAAPVAVRLSPEEARVVARALVLTAELVELGTDEDVKA